MSEADAVLVERDGPVTIVSINRPHCRNAVDGLTARKLYDTFLAFDADEMRGGLQVIASGETLAGATRFASGAGRHGAFGGDRGPATPASHKLFLLS